MKKWTVWILCVAAGAVLCGCGPDPELILRGDAAFAAAGEEDVLSADMPERQTQPAQRIYVYICGAVNEPGVYEMDADSRIFQLVEEAGGVCADADVQGVNLAGTMTDGQMIRIPFLAEQTDGKAEPEAQTGISADGRININTATREQLMTLNGIGASKADRILAYREANGPFRSTEEITNVEGIKEGTYEKIKDMISVQ